MTIELFQDGEKWLLAKNLRFEDTGGIHGKPGPSPRGRDNCDGFWSREKEKWVGTRGMGTRFDSIEEALDYMEENRGWMESV